MRSFALFRPVQRLFLHGLQWQNISYNQPPHTSYFLSQDMQAPPAPSITYTGTDPGPGELVNGEPDFVPAPADAKGLKPGSRI